MLSLLRPGKRPSGEEAARVFRHVIGRIRRHWPRVEIAVRGDGHYGTPEVMDLLEDQGCGYILGLPGNARLSGIGQPWSEDAAVRGVQSRKDKVRRFFQTDYRAGSWSRARKVIARVEATVMILPYSFFTISGIAAFADSQTPFTLTDITFSQVSTSISVAD